MAKFHKGMKRPKGAGRKTGVPNKKTVLAREAIAKFVDGNAGRLQSWLDKVANGVLAGTRISEKTGKVIKVYHVRPNPQRAFELFQSVIEYHVPKLSRSELTGGDGQPLLPPQLSVSFNDGGPGISSTEVETSVLPPGEPQ